jgi:hypothetical protein
MGDERFARRMFRWSAIWGVLVLTPLYLLPPPPVRAEAFYGFIGSALAFQAVYWIIGGDPSRFRALMPVAAVAKVSFVVPSIVLFVLGRMDAATLALILVDLVLAVGFMVAWRRTAMG